MTIDTAIILAAGYGNRIRDFNKLSDKEKESYKNYLQENKELLQNTPKPLLPVWGHPIVSLLVKKIENETDVKRVYVVTNSNYFPAFNQWQNSLATGLEVKVIDNGVGTMGQGQGWMLDLYSTIKSQEIDEDILTFYGDTIFGLNLRDFIDFYDHKKSNILAAYHAPRDDLHRRGIVVLEDDDKVKDYLEKPNNPPSDLAGIMPYILKRETLNLLSHAFTENYNPELNLMQWLTSNKLTDVYAFKFEDRIDIGKAPDLCEVNKMESLVGWRFEE